MEKVKFDVRTVGGDKRTLSVEDENILITNYKPYNPTSTLLTSVDSIEVDGNKIIINAWDNRGKQDSIRAMVFESYLDPYYLRDIDINKRDSEYCKYAYNTAKTLADMVSCDFRDNRTNE